jgi:hypothetical protein
VLITLSWLVVLVEGIGLVVVAALVDTEQEQV